MLALLRRVKRWGLAWLYFHLLLWATLAATGGGGETCRSGASAGGSDGGAFRCPQASDGADAGFCCGTCSAPHCCSSEAARLDQAQCPAAPPTERTTAAPTPSTTPPFRHPDMTGVMIVTFVSILALGTIGCGLSLCCSRFLRPSRNRDQQNVPLQPNVPSDLDQSMFGQRPSDCADLPPPYDPSPYSEECPHGHGTSPPASNIPPVARLAFENPGYQGDGAQPGLPHPSEATLELGSFSPSQACAASSVPAPSDDDSRGPRTSAWAGFVDAAGYSNASTVPSDDPPPYSLEDPYDSQALAATRATLLDSSPSPAGVSSPSSSDAEACRGVPRQRSPSVEGGPPTYSSPSDDPPPYSCDDLCHFPSLAATLGDRTPSWAGVPSSGSSPSDGKAPRGTRRRHFASVQRGPPRDSSASASDCNDPPPYSVADPQDSQALAAARTLLTLLDSSPSQASVSSPVLSLSKYEALGARPPTSASVGRGPRSTDEESRGTRSGRSASAGRGPPRYNPTSSLDYDGRRPYSAKDPPDSQALDAAQTLATLLGNPLIWLDVNTDLRDAPPGRSARASPPVSPEDPPTYSAALGPDRRALPRALEGPPAVLLLPENPGAAEDEEMLVVPPDLLDIARGGPLLEPMAEAEELDVPPA